MASPACSDLGVSLFVAGPVFDDLGVSIFVAVTVFGEIWADSRARNDVIFNKMRLRSAKRNFGEWAVRDDELMVGSWGEVGGCYLLPRFFLLGAAWVRSRAERPSVS